MILEPGQEVICIKDVVHTDTQIFKKGETFIADKDGRIGNRFIISGSIDYSSHFKIKQNNMKKQLETAIHVTSVKQYDAVIKHLTDKGWLPSGIKNNYSDEYPYIRYADCWNCWSHPKAFDVITFNSFSNLFGVTAEPEMVEVKLTGLNNTVAIISGNRIEFKTAGSYRAISQLTTSDILTIAEEINKLTGE